MEMKETALIYAGEWMGEGANRAINYLSPEYVQLTKLGFAAGLPLLTLTKQVQKRDWLETIMLLVGAYLATKA